MVVRLEERYTVKTLNRTAADAANLVALLHSRPNLAVRIPRIFGRLEGGLNRVQALQSKQARLERDLAVNRARLRAAESTLGEQVAGARNRLRSAEQTSPEEARLLGGRGWFGNRWVA